MSSNVKRICVMCGREFNAKHGGQAFCSMSCRKRYGNHISFNCNECRTLPCEYRKLGLSRPPKECPNYKWSC